MLDVCITSPCSLATYNSVATVAHLIIARKLYIITVVFMYIVVSLLSHYSMSVSLYSTIHDYSVTILLCVYFYVCITQCRFPLFAAVVCFVLCVVQRRVQAAGDHIIPHSAVCGQSLRYWPSRRAASDYLSADYCIYRSPGQHFTRRCTQKNQRRFVSNAFSCRHSYQCMDTRILSQLVTFPYAYTLHTHAVGTHHRRRHLFVLLPPYYTFSTEGRSLRFKNPRRMAQSYNY